jgi:probable F420-dependent oxidoreductase
MHLGLALPFGDIGGDGAIVREFAELAEAEGYDGLTLADHVLGGNPANPASGRAGGLGLFHDPFVEFGFLAACTKKVELSTQVLILAQRQTVLVAKQAASLDVLSGGRFRFGVGVGWNELEFIGLNENFHNRGKRSEEQVQVMKALWADPYVTFDGKWHRLADAGINPRPPSRRIPLWFGGHMDVTLQRIAKWGDGWMMLSEPRNSTSCAVWWTPRGAIPPRSGSKSGPRPARAPKRTGARRSASGKKRASRTSRCTTPLAAITTSAWPAGA